MRRLSHYLVSYGADELRPNVLAATLGEKHANFPGRHPAGIHGDVLVVKTVIMALVLGN